MQPQLQLQIKMNFQLKLEPQVQTATATRLELQLQQQLRLQLEAVQKFLMTPAASTAATLSGKRSCARPLTALRLSLTFVLEHSSSRLQLSWKTTAFLRMGPVWCTERAPRRSVPSVDDVLWQGKSCCRQRMTRQRRAT